MAPVAARGLYVVVRRVRRAPPGLVDAAAAAPVDPPTHLRRRELQREHPFPCIAIHGCHQVVSPRLLDLLPPREQAAAQTPLRRRRERGDARQGGGRGFVASTTAAPRRAKHGFDGDAAVGGRRVPAAAEEQAGARRHAVVGAGEPPLGVGDGAVAGGREGDGEGGGGRVERGDRVGVIRRGGGVGRPEQRRRGVAAVDVAGQHDGAAAGEAERVGDDQVAAPAATPLALCGDGGGFMSEQREEEEDDEPLHLYSGVCYSATWKILTSPSHCSNHIRLEYH